MFLLLVTYIFVLSATYYSVKRNSTVSPPVIFEPPPVSPSNGLFPPSVTSSDTFQDRVPKLTFHHSTSLADLDTLPHDIPRLTIRISPETKEKVITLQHIISLPARSTNPALGKQIDIPLSNPHGSGVKLYVKAMVKVHPLFNYPITTDPPINGWSYKGEPIPINTLGLWIFGTTGYDGNVKFLPDEGRIRMQVPLETPDEVEILLRSFYKPEYFPKPLVPEVTEESFSKGLSGTGGEDALKTQVKTWVLNRQVSKLR